MSGEKVTFAYWTEVQSANPHPTCRRGGCGNLANEGSEWCEEHGADVDLGQAWAMHEMASRRREGRHPIAERAI